jgi:GT2 family glycosyltransferase
MTARRSASHPPVEPTPIGTAGDGHETFTVACTRPGPLDQAADPPAGPAAVTVVMITRDRAEEARTAVMRLLELPERPPVIVVDNDSSDHTLTALDGLSARVTVIGLDHNAGAAGRNVGVRHATTPYVAFADDDSAWAPGSLACAARILDAHPRLAVVAARILVGDDGTIDPVSSAMAASPLAGDASLPGRPVLGFVACGAVVRREPFLAVGGFDEHYGVGGEEHPVAVALAAAGWSLAYVDTCIARHWPSPVRDVEARRRTMTRNDLWSWWRHRRWWTAVRLTARVAGAARRDPVVRAGLCDALRGAAPVLRARRRVSRSLEQQLELLDARPDR